MFTHARKFWLMATSIAVVVGLMLTPGCDDDDDSSDDDSTTVETNITWAVAATVSLVVDLDNLLNDFIRIGDTVTGTIVFNNTVADANDSDTVADYWHTTAPYGMYLAIGDLAFETDPDDVNFLFELINDHGTPAHDGHLFRSYNNFPLSLTLDVNHISWQLDDATGTALDSTDIPAEPPALTNWTQGFGLTITGNDAADEWSTFLIRATVTSVTAE